MTLVLKKANSNESLELAWSEKALKHLLSMGAKATCASALPTRGTKLFLEVPDPQTTKSTLEKEGLL